MQIMAWDAKRSMEIQMQKTIEALVMQKRLKAASENGGESNGITLLTQAELQQAPLLTLKVHRNNLIEESLTQVSRQWNDMKQSDWILATDCIPCYFFQALTTRN